MQTIDLRKVITEEFQNELQDVFAHATGFGVVFTDAEGNQIGHGENFCRFCNKINEMPEGADYCTLSNKNAIQLALERKKPSIYICHAGLVNIAIPLIYEGECVGAITAGQVLCAEKNVYPQDTITSSIDWLSDPELAAYYQEIEVMSCQRIDATTTGLSNLTNAIVHKIVYAQMQEELARKSEALLIAENQLKQAKLDALQKQVTPHFIFNVLNSISRLLSLQEYTTAEQMLTSFAQMMRYSLSNLKSSVLLEDELNYIKNYLAIQNIRFGDCVDYQIECDPALHSLKIPFFSLQPLVENSIAHGLLTKPHGGRLLLSCKQTPHGAVITVADNGIGIPAVRLDEITSGLHKANDSPIHVGLKNSYKRFQLMFDQRFSFTMFSEPDIGTEITITIQDE